MREGQRREIEGDRGRSHTCRKNDIFSVFSLLLRVRRGLGSNASTCHVPPRVVGEEGMPRATKGGGVRRASGAIHLVQDNRVEVRCKGQEQLRAIAGAHLVAKKVVAAAQIVIPLCTAVASGR